MLKQFHIEFDKKSNVSIEQDNDNEQQNNENILINNDLKHTKKSCENFDNKCNVSDQQILNLFFKLEMLDLLEAQSQIGTIKFDVKQFKSIQTKMLEEFNYKFFNIETGKIRQYDKYLKQGFITSDNTKGDVHFHEKVFLQQNLDIDCIILNNISIKFDVFHQKKEKFTALNPSLVLNENDTFIKQGYIFKIDKRENQGFIIKECTFDNSQPNTYQFHFNSFYNAILEPNLILENNIMLRFQIHKSPHSKNQKATSIVCVDDLGNDISMLTRKMILQQSHVQNQDHEKRFKEIEHKFNKLYDNSKNFQMSRLLN